MKTTDAAPKTPVFGTPASSCGQPHPGGPVRVPKDVPKSKYQNLGERTGCGTAETKAGNVHTEFQYYTRTTPNGSSRKFACTILHRSPLRSACGAAGDGRAGAGEGRALASLMV